MAAHQIVAFIVSRGPADLPLLEEVTVDWRVLGFAAAATLASALAFGLAPAWSTSRTDPREALQSAGRGFAEGEKRSRLSGILVGAEVGLSTVLLVAAGLLLHSFLQVIQRPLGFEAENVATVGISLPPAIYPNPADRRQVHRAIMERLEGLPGVHSVGAVT